MLLFKTGLLPMVPFESEFGKEVTIGCGADLEGDVRWRDVELLEFLTAKAGFENVELGPLVSNNRVDNTYRPEGYEITGYSARASTMIKTYFHNRKSPKQVKISACVQPSFSLANLPPE